MSVNSDHSDQGDDASLSHALPGQSQHQGIKLGALQPAVGTVRRRPDELALVQPARGQPDADAVMHEYLDTVGALIGKEISRVRMRGAEDGYHSGQRGIGAGAHVQRRGGQPGSIDADHRSHSRSQAAHEADASKGQLTVTEPVGRLISMRMSVKVLACGSSGDKARLPISPTLGG